MDRELLLEIGVEEMPASWLPPLAAELASTLKTRLTESGLPVKVSIESHATPRRLAPARRRVRKVHPIRSRWTSSGR